MISINDLRLLSTQITEKSLLCPSRISSICPPTLRQICPWVCTILCLCHLHNMSKRAHNRNLLYLSSNSPTKLGTWFLCSCHHKSFGGHCAIFQRKYSSWHVYDMTSFNPIYPITDSYHIANQTTAVPNIICSSKNNQQTDNPQSHKSQ